MTSQTTDEQLLDLERAYWNAIRDRDADAALRLTDDPCVVAGAQGVGRLPHAMMRQMLGDTSWTLHEYEIGDDAIVQRIGEDVALVAYTVTERLTVQGAPVTLIASDTSVWTRRGGTWRCALHTESIKGDPFGRDRTPR